MVLNYKGIDYKTEWVEYPDLVSTFKSFGLPPNEKDSPGFFADYTSPAIKLDDGTYIMDSWKIVFELEKRVPSPSLHLDDPVVIQVRDHIPNLRNPLAPEIMAKVARNLLNPRSAEYFERTREKRFGMPLAQFEKEKGGEQCWKDVEQPAKEIAGWLKKHDGPFFLGETVSYADFIFVSFIQFLKRIDDEKFERFTSLDPTFSRIYDASKQWLAKDD
ncbi:hypothetical protein BCR34DRAFT_480523 [Clohesyomyces aquaticus]|uniref:Uncharacterized protein n=1 Tax=Clohesyomyces aquaticus TaxID=1231657 RepID=A0A1Y1ZV96_9PLEO|nr:hypothetical protein BCR34DRAFT_480523 [Clohesyomyces aquaticus]